MTVNLICSEKEKIVCSGGWCQWMEYWVGVWFILPEDCNFFMDPSMTKCQQEYGTFLAQSRITSCNHCSCFPCREHWLSGLHEAKSAFEHNQKQLQQLKKKPKHTIQIFDTILALFTNCGYQMYRFESHLIMQIIREPQWHELWYTHLSRS